MQFRVTVPEGVEGGQVVSVNAAGTQFDVRVPKNIKAGGSFLFEIEPDTKAGGKQHGSHVTSTNEPVIFHDYKDLGMALCLGFAIGFSIVFGFVLGVLYATEPLVQAQ